MAHASENAQRLVIQVSTPRTLTAIDRMPTNTSGLWLFILPARRRLHDLDRERAWVAQIQAFAQQLPESSLVALLTSPEEAAAILPELTTALQLQLWVAVQQAPTAAVNALPECHAALLILSRYRGSLRHTKTRIAYTYCPFCDKTTKDYGGKKHTYHEYGTLMSDVWRDIELTDDKPTPIVERLADVFGLPELGTLHVVNLQHVAALQPVRRIALTAPKSRPAIAQPAQLRCGDVLQELRHIPTNSIDYCFADPPYNLAKHYDIWDDALDVNNYLAWCQEWITELARVLRPHGTCTLLNIPSLAVKHFQQMQTAGLTFQHWIVWEGLSLPVRMIMPAHYSLVSFSKGPPRALPGLAAAHTAAENHALTSLRPYYCVRSHCVQARRTSLHQDRESISDLWWDIHRLKHNSKRVEHPCQLPPALMDRLIALYTNVGETVLDPFNGSGTTTLCAARLGRNYIGLELSEQYHTLAQQRHAALARGEDPFAKVKRIPQAKNSRVKRAGGAQYQVSKKTLQLEVKRIAQELGKIPTRDELTTHSVYPIWMYDQYFISWGEVCAAARTTGMRETRTTPPRPTRPQQGTLFDE